MDVGSLGILHRSIPIAHESESFWIRLQAFMGPGALVAVITAHETDFLIYLCDIIELYCSNLVFLLLQVGYMDPGNWATDIAAGSAYNYKLLFVILMSSVVAMFLQELALRLGVAAQLDLAQACRLHFSRPVSIFMWITAEIAIAACDLAEV